MQPSALILGFVSLFLFMPDTIGRITVPSPGTPSSTFPLTTDYPYGRNLRRSVVVHQFGSANAKIEQRFFVGNAAQRFQFKRSALPNLYRAQLRNFFDSMSGPLAPFFYKVPQEDGSTVTHTVCFENAPLTFNDLTNAVCSVGVTFVDIPDPSSAPTYSLASTVTRFPSNTLSTALLSQVQQLIPLVRIRVADNAVPDIFLSDQRVTIGTQLYLPRLLDVGDPRSGALLQQSIDGSADDVTFSFGNADRVMVQVANDTNLIWGRIEFSLFHVGTGIKLDLWAGYIVDWQSNAGPVFTLKASDILSALTLSSPVGTVSRTCSKRYQVAADGCTASGAIDTTHFPSGDGASCDLGYNTPNGCMAHQNYTQYGAEYAVVQNVLLRSGGIGFTFNPGLFFLSPLAGLLGSVSTWYPRTSIIADTVYGTMLPEIWHDDDGFAQYGLPVSCPIIAGRDEDQFYIALGLVGKGPIGGFTPPQMWDSNGDGIPDTFLGSMLDGMPNHGFKTDSKGNVTDPTRKLLGLRQVLGTDPAGAYDFFSLGRVATAAAGWFTQASDGSLMQEVLDASGTSAYNNVFAAGVAFCEIRRTKPNSDPLTSPGQHSMIALVSQGLAGWTWTAPGSRSSVPGLTNPVWIAVNTLIRALGLNTAAAAVQEPYFDVNQAIAMAAICDDVVPQVIGSGTEKQWRFKGSIDTRKPTRDWIQQILNSACGFYSWSFGQLRIGLRENASAASAFTAGNMLFKSLVLQPIKPRFEKLSVSFADQDYQFQANTVDYLDQDYATRVNRAQNPFTSTFALSGVSTKSQAGRIAVVRTREELGGVGAAEQTNGRLASFKTTVLALEVEPGMVISITDPDVPGGSGNFRIESMRFNKDWSIDVMARSVTAFMYNMVIGPKPADVKPAPIPQEIAHGWQPNQVQAPSNDALFPNEFNFDVEEDYVTSADGSPNALLLVTGKLPVENVSVRVKGYRHIHSGIIGAKVTAVGVNTIACHDLIDASLTPLDLSGRVISVLGRPNASVPFNSFKVNVSGWDPSTGTFTVTPDPSSIVQVGDAISIRYLGSDNSAHLTSISDGGIENQTNGYLGMTPGAEVGRVLLVIQGTGRGETRKITANTATQFSWDVPLLLDATSVWIIIEAAELFPAADSTRANVSDTSAAAAMPISALNFLNQAACLIAVTVDSRGVESPLYAAPIREIWIYGAQGTREITADATMLPTDGLVLCDTGSITQPTPTTLSADITDTTSTSVQLIDGSATVRGSDILCGTERMRIVGGEGTNNPTVQRGAAGSTAATHASGDAVTLPGGLVFTLLPISQIPNQGIQVQKDSADINYVKVVCGGLDTFRNGSTYKTLPDNSAEAGFADLKAPG